MDVFFLLIGAVLVFFMHAGFAFLEAGTVRTKNQVNALVKILTDFCASTIAYFFIGYFVAYGVHFFDTSAIISGINERGGFAKNGYDLMKFFFLLTFAAAIPAIISGGIAERAKFLPQFTASILIVAFIYPFFEGIIWNGNFGVQQWLEGAFGYGFHDFAGSVVVHGVGGWMALAAILLLGVRKGSYKGGKLMGFKPSNILFLTLGSWILCVGWFGFNVMSAQNIEGISGLVAINSLMAMVGGTLISLLLGRNDPGFTYNGALAGLVAACAGSDIMHPLGALATGGVAGFLFTYGFKYLQNLLHIDDVLGVWPLHGVCGLWGGIAAGIFGQDFLGGLGGVSLISQILVSILGCAYAMAGGALIYGVLKYMGGIRLSLEDEFKGADLAIHKISSTNL